MFKCTWYKSTMYLSANGAKNTKNTKNENTTNSSGASLEIFLVSIFGMTSVSLSTKSSKKPFQKFFKVSMPENHNSCSPMGSLIVDMKLC